MNILEQDFEKIDLTNIKCHICNENLIFQILSFNNRYWKCIRCPIGKDKPVNLISLLTNKHFTLCNKYKEEECFYGIDSKDYFIFYNNIDTNYVHIFNKSSNCREVLYESKINFNITLPLCSEKIEHFINKVKIINILD